MRLLATTRAAGSWGIVFVVLLLVSAAMVSVPTAAESGSRIAAFYSAHAEVIVIQQIVGLFALAAFIAFVLLLPPNRWLRLALGVFVATELVTNLVPLAIVLMTPTADTTQTLTFVEDLADSAFFISIALFVSAVTLSEPTWLRITGYVIALASVIRAVGSPLGMTALDQVAPLAFVAFVLVLSIKQLIRPQSAGLPRTEAV